MLQTLRGKFEIENFSRVNNERSSPGAILLLIISLITSGFVNGRIVLLAGPLISFFSALLPHFPI